MWVKQRMRDGYSAEYRFSPPAVLPSDTGHFLPEIALFLGHRIIVNAKLLANIKQQFRIRHAVFGGQ